MGRQAAAPSRAQKWQVAGNSRATASVDHPSEDEHGGSTRIPSSGHGSPSASSTELGRQAPSAEDTRTAAEIQKEKDERARWADVESDGEEGTVFNGKYKNRTVFEEAPDDTWMPTKKGSKSSKGKGKGKGSEAPVAARERKPEPKPSRERWEDAPKPKSNRYLEDDQLPRHSKSNSYLEERFQEASWEKPRKADSWGKESRRAAEPQWEASSWGSSAKGGHDSWSRAKGGHDSWSNEWDEGGWGQAEVHTRKAQAPAPKEDSWRKEEKSSKPKGGKSESFGGGGFSETRRGGFSGKNESFKRGPSVATNMDSSRLAW